MNLLKIKSNIDGINAFIGDLDAACQKHGVKLNAEVMGDGQGGKLVRAFAVMSLTFSLMREDEPDPLHDHDSNAAAETLHDHDSNAAAETLHDHDSNAAAETLHDHDSNAAAETLHDGSGQAEPADAKAKAENGTQTPSVAERNETKEPCVAERNATETPSVPKAEEDQPSDAEPVELPKQKKKVDGIVNDGIEPTPKPLHEGFNPETDIDLKKFRRVINGLPGKTLREKMATASRYVGGELSVAQIQYYYYMRFDFKKGQNPLVLATMNQLFNMADARVIMDCMENTGCVRSSVPNRIRNSAYTERMARQDMSEIIEFMEDGQYEKYSQKVERADTIIQ